MRRRKYLALTAGAASLTGCSSGGSNADEGDTGGAGDSPETTTEAKTETEVRTEAPQSAEFEVIGVEAPDEVQAGEEHSFTIRVRNTGEQSGTFEATLEMTTSEVTRWEEIGPIRIEDIPAGKTKEFVSNEISFDQAYQLQFRLVDYNAEWSYDVVVPQPDITLGESSLVQVDAGYETRPMAGVLVTNKGDSTTGAVPITVDWLDSAGEYLASSSTDLRVIGIGETWSARVDPLIDVDDYSVINDFDVSVGDVSPATSINPDNLTASGVELKASESQVLVRGQVQNKRSSTVDYISVTVKVYNKKGEIIGSEWTNETEIASGNAFRFELEPNTKGRNGDVDSAQVVVSDSAL